ARKFAMVRALLDEDEFIDLAKPFPDFSELSGQELAEDRADAHICEIIAAASNRASARGIISVLGIIKCLLHAAGAGNRVAGFDFGPNMFDQNVIAGAHLIISLSR